MYMILYNIYELICGEKAKGELSSKGFSAFRNVYLYYIRVGGQDWTFPDILLHSRDWQLFIRLDMNDVCICCVSMGTL